MNECVFCRCASRPTRIRTQTQRALAIFVSYLFSEKKSVWLRVSFQSGRVALYRRFSIRVSAEKKEKKERDLQDELRTRVALSSPSIQKTP